MFADGNKKVEARLPRTLAHIVRSPVLKEYGRDQPCGPNRRRPESVKKHMSVSTVGNGKPVETKEQPLLSTMLIYLI